LFEIDLMCDGCIELSFCFIPEYLFIAPESLERGVFLLVFESACVNPYFSVLAVGLLDPILHVSLLVQVVPQASFLKLPVRLHPCTLGVDECLDV